MEDIFLRESQIFSREFKKEDFLNLIKSKEKKNDELLNETDFGEEKGDNQLDFSEIKELLKEFSKYFLQEDMEKIKNHQNILHYFYWRELIISHFIEEKYENNNHQRYLNIRVSDFILKFLFEENSSISKIAKFINKKISEINDSYLEKNGANDLTDKTYLDKVFKALGTTKIPRFLLKNGYRLRREIQKDQKSL